MTFDSDELKLKFTDRAYGCKESITLKIETVMRELLDVEDVTSFKSILKVMTKDQGIKLIQVFS